jgi:hypothetical protein
MKQSQKAMKQSQKVAKAAFEMRGGGTAMRKRKLPMTHKAAKEAASCNKAAVAAVSPAASEAARAASFNRKDDGASDSVGNDAYREVVDDALIDVVGSFDDNNLFHFLPSFDPISTIARPLIAPFKEIGEFCKCSFFLKMPPSINLSTAFFLNSAAICFSCSSLVLLCQLIHGKMSSVPMGKGLRSEPSAWANKVSVRQLVGSLPT